MNATTDNATRNGSAATDSSTGLAGSQSLCRPTDDRIVAGVAAGVARTLGVDPLIVRIGFVVLALLGAAGLPLYLAGWLLIPEQGAEQSIAADFMGPRSR
jgi:phage shock protein PspC (stress-responsive transcriptional regulator)